MEQKKKNRSAGQKVKPSRRRKKRYIKFALECREPLSKRDAETAISRLFFSVFGPKGLVEISPKLIEFSQGENAGIIRCSRAELQKAEKGILSLKKVKSCSVKPRILAESGTLKSVRRAGRQSI